MKCIYEVSGKARFFWCFANDAFWNCFERSLFKRLFEIGQEIPHSDPALGSKADPTRQMSTGSHKFGSSSRSGSRKSVCYSWSRQIQFLDSSNQTIKQIYQTVYLRDCISGFPFSQHWPNCALSDLRKNVCKKIESLVQWQTLCKEKSQLRISSA